MEVRAQVDQGGAGGPLSGVRRTLRRVRRTARLMLLSHRVAVLIGVAAAAAAALAIMDYFLRTPDWLRALLLAAGVLVAAWWIVRRVYPAARFSPSLTEVALRIERSRPGAAAGLSGMLASGLELGGAGDELSGPVVAEARRRFGNVRARALVAPERLVRSVVAAVVVVLTVGAAWVASPALAQIGARRVFTPWASVAWPKRTAVADATGLSVYPLGSAVPLRAALLKSGVPFERARVWAVYRVIEDGGAGAERRVALTDQRKTVEAGSGDTGRLFERLVEPSGAAAGPGQSATLEYWFETEDDQTQPVRVTLVEPPAVVGATISVTPPAYASDAGVVRDYQSELGPGSDERAVAQPVLAGSRVSLDIQLNKPVPRGPRAAGSREGALADWAATTLGDDAAALLREDGSASLETAPSSWTLSWTAARAVSVRVSVADEHGIASAEDAAYRVDVLSDLAPTVSITDPTEDRTVLATAAVGIVAEARDDVALAWASVEAEVRRPPEGSQGAPPEPIGPAGELVRVAAAETDGAADDGLRRLVVERELTLSALAVRPGDEVHLTAVAADAYDVGGQTHEPARSRPRRLMIISESAFVEQLWADLSGVRRQAIRADEEQARLAETLSRPMSADAVSREQSGLTDQIARAGEMVARAERRLRENQFEDAALDAILAESRRRLSDAASASAEAARAAEELAGQQQEGSDGDARVADRAARAQNAVRDNLAELAELLDRGEDDWAVRRELERIIQDQQELRERTQDVGARTTGKDPSGLSAEDRRALDEIAGRQAELADRTEEAVQALLDRAAQVEQQDPAGAEALAEAARAAQRGEAQSHMERAAEQARQNQTNSAQQQQDEALSALEAAMQAIENAGKNRDEVLRRHLASLIESLEALVKRQEEALGTLRDASAAGGPFDGLDGPMVRIHDSTLAAADQAAAGPRELGRIVGLLSDAGAAQAYAVIALRDEPINISEVEAQEEISLAKLVEARDEARQMDREAQQRQQSRERSELRKAYADAMAAQAELRDQTALLIDAERDRRTRNAARRLSGEQTDLRNRMSELRQSTRGLGDAVVFDFAHTRLDTLMGRAAERLDLGEPDRVAARSQEAAIDLLRSLVEALDEAAQQAQDFREHESESGSQGGQGGGQQGGDEPLVPSMAEIKLLRALQAQALAATRDADDLGDTDLASDAATMQRELLGAARELMESLSRQPGRAPAPPSPDAGGAGATEPPVPPPPTGAGDPT